MSEKEIKLTISDPWLGEREIAPGYVALIRDQLRLLKAFRDDGRKPNKMLLEDIKVYEFILEHPQAEQMAEQYMIKMNQLRQERNSYSVAKIEAAKALGWFQ